MIPDGAIASGVISKIINDLTDVSKSKIKKAVEDKKNKHKNLESQLYNLIVSVLKELYDNSYDRNSDKIYDTAEKLLKNSYDRVEAAFQLMLEDGMLYHTNMCHKKVIECEMAVFANMLEIIHLWSNKSFNSVGLIDYYIKYNRSRALNLSRMNLKGANLIQADLILADLVQADLRGADLTEADLRGADLRQADLRRADLEGANLTQANLSLADMSSADLRRSKLDNSIWLEYDIQKAISQLRKADFRCILLFEGIGRIKKINKKELFADEE